MSETNRGAAGGAPTPVQELAQRLDGYTAAGARLGHKPPPELLNIAREAISECERLQAPTPPDQREPVAWRPVLGFEGRYEVSSAGSIRSLKTGELLSPLGLAGAGYPKARRRG